MLKLSKFFCVNLNYINESYTFLEQLQYADAKQDYIKNSRAEKENYKPLCILPNISKIYERCEYEQLYVYFYLIF